VKPPRVLDPRGWHPIEDAEIPAESGTASQAEEPGDDAITIDDEPVPAPLQSDKLS
jgi:hypothetical protein